MMKMTHFARNGLGLLALASLVNPIWAASEMNLDHATRLDADNPHIRYSGRSEGIGTDTVTFGHSGARVRLRFEGTSVGAWIDDESQKNYCMVWLDGEPGKKFQLNHENDFYTLAHDLEPGEHTVEVVRVTEGFLGLAHFKGFALDHDAEVLDWQTAHDRKIEFIGDSITCGYGVEANDPKEHFTPATENFCLGYSGLTARRLDADYLVVSRSGIGMVRNYDGPYDGSDNAMPDIYPQTFYTETEPKWDFDRFTPDVVCINLGTNDFSTTGVNVDNYVSAYVTFAGKVLDRYPEAELVVLEGPMNNSKELRAALDRVVDQLQEQAPERVHFFELSAQGELGYGADYHPNRAQSRRNADELTAYLADLMDWQ